MGFRDILGHERQITTLTTAIRRDKVHHAYLFVGAPGIGRRTVAMTFARALNCERQDGDACDACGSCRKILAGTHPDIQFVGEDRTKLQIVIEEVREKIQRFISFKIYEGRYRVILVLDAERMNSSTANALLKTLEEPPKQTVFVLTTTNLNSLLPTIRSRCQKLRFSPIDEGAIAAHLERELRLPTERAALLGRLSRGSLGRAMGMTEEQLAARDEFLNALLLVGSDSDHDPLAMAEQLASDKHALLSQLELTETFLRDSALLDQAPSSPLWNPDKLEALARFSSSLSFPHLYRLLSLVWELRGAVRLNITPLVALERLFLEIAQARQVSQGPAYG